ncbi:MAG: hypothetical protein AVDCRST_MAG36-2924 [uncultured Nocardioidaceae bacterium]|uniref:Uncharacterized protein n=1 Tax=uncultured Nocardioidaceae bacterium TaxID=253824 RepID=A0A6J4MNH5_9ACTN|nr:MAG: hypothetical protein AVDCRST_MAG36-2924 [uncultured Nocardioidaceae bacterium]
MASIVMRVRLTNGDHTDVAYEDTEAVDEAEVVERVLSILSSESGVLRCQHGDRLVALFARGVATVEVAPQGAIL